MTLTIFLFFFLMLFGACTNDAEDLQADNEEPQLFMNYQKKVILQKEKRDESIEGIPWSANQSIAIFDNYLFIFLEGWKENNPLVCIFDRTNNELLNFQEIFINSPNVRNHCNSAQFSNTYYEEGDEFPLLYMSTYFGGYLHVIRLSRNGNEFTFDIVQTMSTDNHAANIYGNSYSIDPINKKLYMYYNENGNYQQITNNDLIIEEYDLPNLEEKEILLTKEKIISSMKIPFVVFQGSCFCENRLLLGVQGRDNFLADGSYVLTIQMNKHEIEEIILVKGGEPEGLAVSDGKLYISLRKNLIQHPREKVFSIFELTPKGSFEN